VERDRTRLAHRFALHALTPLRRYGTRRIRANLVYQEFIQERHHLHMNATRWTSLSSFVKHLGREGVVRAEENEKGWFIEWVDNSPAALARQDALQKMNRAKIDEETRGRKYLQEQIERAKREQGDDRADAAAPEAGLQRDGDAPIRIGISLKPKADADTSSSAASGSGTSAPEATGGPSQSAPASAPAPLKLGLVSSAKAQPAVRPNAFKAASSSSSKAASGSGPGAGRSSMTAAERIMAEEQEQRQKRESFGPQPSAKRMRM
jgi:DNA/RNA-binding protein KIN17